DIPVQFGLPYGKCDNSLSGSSLSPSRLRSAERGRRMIGISRKAPSTSRSSLLDTSVNDVGAATSTKQLPRIEIEARPDVIKFPPTPLFIARGVGPAIGM